MRTLTIALAGLFISTATVAMAVQMPTNWDGLVEVKSKKLAYVYLLPNEDFRPYSKVQLDPVEIATQKTWLRDFNRTADISRQISESDVKTALTKVASQFDKDVAQEFTNAGYAVATAPAADVLRVSIALVNVTVAAPDTGIGRTFSADAGQATLILEARDSLTNQLLGRAVDEQLAGNEGPMLRTASSNQADFEDLVKTWTKISAKGLTELKTLSPVNTSAMPRK